jgi:protein TonB
MTTPLPPTCPVFHRKPGRGAALGWSASASVVALALSGLAALAMAAAPTGESMGEDAVQVLLLPSAPAIAAQNEPAPEIAAAPPSTPEPPTENEVAPDLTPTETTAPTRPDPTPTLPDLQDDAVAKADLPPTKPAELAEADAPETPAVEPVTKPKPRPEAKPKPKADTPPKDAPKDAPDDLPKPKKTKTASTDAASEAAAPKAAAAESAGSGAKATANYGSAVMKKIRTTKKQRAPAKGTVVVGFAITADGGLASVKVLQSSGSSELDQVALDHIRRSAPFPPPPTGADRKFSFEFVGKG